MKRFTLLMILGAFVAAGAIFNSCQKDELKPEAASVNYLKVASNFDLPIFMDQTDEIGFAVITKVGDLVTVTVDLDETYLGGLGLIVREARLYADEDEPGSNAPGQFPYKVVNPEYDFSFPPLLWTAGQTYWYFALHLDLQLPEGERVTAWLLPDEGGMNWLNKNNKPKGWGEYFIWYFE